MNSFIATLKSLGLGKIAITGAILTVVFGAFLYLISRVSEPDMGLLYSDLELNEASAIVSRIEAQNIPVQIQGGGTQIYVPIDMIAQLRMDLAEAGLPNRGSVGYEIFDKSEAFGSSIFVQNINRIRALEGELSRTIRTISQISAARVHLVIPKKEIFSKDTESPSASIVLRLHGPGQLDNTRVQAIQHLVASAVPGLSTKHVSIIDDRGQLLSAGNHEQTGALPTKIEEYREAYETRLERSIDTLLGRTLGMGKVRTEVSADINFDRITENSEIYDPEGQVPRSTQTVQEGSSSKDRSANHGLTIESELPNAGENPEGANSSTSATNRSEETVNYEISKTIRTYVKEMGDVNKLSVAVLVDGTYEKNSDGVDVYKPRTPEEIENIKKLVQSAIGLDKGRGDVLEVINMPFSNESIEDIANPEKLFLGFEKHHVIRIAETLILVVFGFVMVMMVIRPLLARLARQDPAPTGNADPNTPPESPTPQVSTAPKPQVATQSAVQQIDGDLQESTLKQITQVIDKHPEESVDMIRNWMNG